MLVGYSLSPGGLLLPYHLGALASLQYHSHLPAAAPIAGASAGAIAVTSHAMGVHPHAALDATTRLSARAEARGGAWGNLLPLLREELEDMVDDEAHERLNAREGMVGISYREIFPRNVPVLKTKFDTREELIDSVCDSSTFPFFTSQWPCAVRPRRTGEGLPRLVVDGFFAVPRDRYGCPDFDHALLEGASESEGETDSRKVQRTVTVAVFPHETVGITASESHNQISPLPQEDSAAQMGRLMRLATQSAGAEEYQQIYEEGWADAERWCAEEDERDLRNWKEENEGRRRRGWVAARKEKEVGIGVRIED